MVDAPVSGRRVKRSTVRTLLVVVICLVVLIGAIVGGSYLLEKIQVARQEKQQATMNEEAGRIAAAISGPLDSVRQQLLAIANQDKVKALFEARDKSGLSALSDKLTNDHASLLKLRMFLPDEYEMDREASPPLGFASLELLMQVVQSGQRAEAEVHNAGSEDEHVVIVEPVFGSKGEVTGLLHASLSPEPYARIDGEAFSQAGYVELVQPVGDKLAILDNAGNSSYRHGDGFTVDIDGSLWQINIWDDSYSPAGQVSFNPANYTWPVLIVVLLLAGWLLYRRRQARNGEDAASSDNIVYGGAARAIMDGKHPGLEKLIPGKQKMGQKEIKPVSQGMEGGDITHSINIDDISKKAHAALADAWLDEPDGSATSGDSDGITVEESDTPSQEDVTMSQEESAGEKTPPAPAARSALSPVIFRAYDIRGVYGDSLTAPVVHAIGQAIGSEAIARLQKTIAVGRDGRLSSPELAEALIKGLCAAGVNVIDIGLVPTPVLYFATHHLDCNSGVMLTGSHNGPEYNGLKIVLNGETLSEKAIQAIRERIETDNLESGEGTLQTTEILADYINRITGDIPVALGGAFKLVVDCGNGVAGAVAPQLFRAMGHDVVELFCEIDGNFPNHHPDPSQPENMQDLINKVKAEQADLGLAFDGDGDRLGVVDSDGNIIWPDQQLMLLAKDVLSRNQGKPIIFDVKCSRYLRAVIESSGGVPLMWKTGHSLIKAKMKAEDAPLAGEMSGHIFFKERWYGFDDAIYTAARLLEILTNSEEKPVEIFAALPGGVATPELRIPLKEKHHQKFMQAMKNRMAFDNAEISDIDGLRVDFADGWGLIRPSNTSPCLVARFEAHDEESLQRIQSEFSTLIKTITPDLNLPF